MNKNGFTLIELMITVAVIGILCAIAYPAYSNYMWKSRQTEAKTLLMRNAQIVERYYTTANRYDGWSGAASSNSAVLAASGVQLYPETAAASSSAYYYFTYAASGTQEYTLQMIPGGANTGQNSVKATLGLKHTGEKTCAAYSGAGCSGSGAPW